MWKSTFGVSRTPFGDLRNQFRRQHCRTINPYGSEGCPYNTDTCALAFMDAVRVTCDARPKVPVGYFRKVAKTMGAIRADSKPLARERGRIFVLVGDEDEPNPRAGRPEHLETGPGEVRSPAARPVAIGDLFRQIRVEPRQGSGQADAGEEGTE